MNISFEKALTCFSELELQERNQKVSMLNIEISTYYGLKQA